MYWGNLIMKKVIILLIIIILLGLVAVIYINFSQEDTDMKKTDKKPVSDYINDPIVLKSKELIMMYGFSEEYFDEHFTLTNFSEFSLPNGAHIEWTFEIEDYQAIVIDSIGYRREGNNYTYIHSLAPADNLELPVIRDFNVISKSEADSLMRYCIGEFINERSKLSLLDSEKGFFYIANPAKGERFDCPQGNVYDNRAPCVERLGIIDLERGSIVSCSN